MHKSDLAELRLHRRILLLSLPLLILAIAPAVAQDPPDGTWLTVDFGPAPGDLSLDWTGGQPQFEVHRSTERTTVSEAVNSIGVTGGRTWIDIPPQDSIFYYRIFGPCVVDPPEYCDGVDNDCNGLIDDSCTVLFSCDPTGDYVELDDPNNNLFSVGSTSEITGLSLSSAGPDFTLGGCIDPAYKTVDVSDGDFFTFSVDEPQTVETRVELTAELGAEATELWVDLFDPADGSFIAGGRYLTTHGLIGKVDLAPGDYWLGVYALNPPPGGPITYQARVLENLFTCPGPGGSPDYTEADESAAGHRANDVLAVTYVPNLTIVETAAADSPESTGIVTAPGTSYAIRGLTADVVSAGDEYLDRDAYLITTGHSTTELHIRLEWPDGDVDMDLFLVAAGDPDDVYGAGTRIGTVDDEEIIVAVDPTTDYWLWVATYDETGFGGDTDLPLFYDLTICARAFP